MTGKQPNEPDNTAVRVALWRALHARLDAKPHVLEDEIGLRIAAPEAGWEQRPDMHPERTKTFRASIVARARFIEDLIGEESARGVDQYVLLGAGLDTFAQRRPDLGTRVRVFEVDQPGPQAWKRGRLDALGMTPPAWLRFVPVDFEAGDRWKERLVACGFNAARPAVVASTGVSMYLSREANAASLSEIASLASGTTLAMTFMLPIELLPAALRPGVEAASKGARAHGTPWLSFFRPEEMLALAKECGFRNVRHVSAEEMARRYFSGRPDGLSPSGGEEMLVART